MQTKKQRMKSPTEGSRLKGTSIGLPLAIGFHLVVYSCLILLVYSLNYNKIGHTKIQQSSSLHSAFLKVTCPKLVDSKSNSDQDIFDEILFAVMKSSEKHEVDPKLVYSVISAESSCRPKARSHKGAIGLMQLMPKTADYLGVINPDNIGQNIEGGTKYLAELLSDFDGNTRLALAAYNAGPGAVKKYNNQVPPYPETLRYIDKVLAKIKLQKI